MPNADARAAFDLAQKHSAELRGLHVQEAALVDTLRGTPVPDMPPIESELRRVRDEWAVAFRAYSAAMKSYHDAVERSRKG